MAVITWMFLTDYKKRGETLPNPRLGGLGEVGVPRGFAVRLCLRHALELRAALVALQRQRLRHRDCFWNKRVDAFLCRFDLEGRDLRERKGREGRE
jgi:hypothetical protein